ncbi:hypothetical protein Leryth_000773 [Lithospermum erythrorhizon]|nr:hypothetical protein Leryth_000773 [Lithospermum erythrorhizon]
MLKNPEAERNSKLRKGSSRLPFVIAARENDDGFGADPEWTLCIADTPSLLLDTSLLLRLGPPEELGLLIETAAPLIDELFREDRPLSESRKTYQMPFRACLQKAQHLRLHYHQGSVELAPI